MKLSGMAPILLTALLLLCTANERNTSTEAPTGGGQPGNKGPTGEGGQTATDAPTGEGGQPGNKGPTGGGGQTGTDAPTGEGGQTKNERVTTTKPTGYSGPSNEFTTSKPKTTSALSKIKQMASRTQPQETSTKPEEISSATSVGGGTVTLSTSSSSISEEKMVKREKKMLWILLPVLGVLAAAVGFGLKSKLTKSHSHADTTENGMENASYQSRPDSSKDGVLLLGVKSGGEEMAAR